MLAATRSQRCAADRSRRPAHRDTLDLRRMHLGGVLARYLDQHPAVTVEVLLSDR